MFEFIFGLVWELICLPVFAIALLSLSSEEPVALIPIGIMALIFNGAGIALLAIGIKKIARDRNTEKFGEEELLSSKPFKSDTVFSKYFEKCTN